MTVDYDLPLVNSCSSVVQKANEIAVRVDRERPIEMSCIAGISGDVASLVATAGRPMLAIDGCPLKCAEPVWNSTT